MNNKKHNHFKPAWWLPGSHLQTLWPIFRRKKRFPIQNERLELLDGDFLDLGWVGEGSGPIILILHGLNGSIQSHYVNGLLHAILKQGWRGVLMHFRGCSDEPNRLARSYHSGETNDLKTVIEVLLKRHPNVPLFVVGYSLGGNVLLKALGTREIHPLVKAAVAISVPFELAKTADYMCQGPSRFYQWYLVRELITQYQKKFKHTRSLLNGDIRPFKTFWEFDHHVTAPLHDFKDAADYYQKSSSRQYLKNIEIPTLIIHAKDDPFTDLSSLPELHEVSANVSLAFSRNGGHVGFVSGIYPWRPIYWLEQKILGFIAEHS